MLKKAIPEPGIVHVIVESPAGATTKIKHEPALDAFSLSRPLPLGLVYPHDWGFIPGTRAPDGDPVDALVLNEGTTYPGLVIPSRPLGVLRLEQNAAEGGGRERNDRIVAVPRSARRNGARHVNDLPPPMREELEQFFINAVFFEPKEPRLLGWGGPDEAWALIEGAVAGG